MVVAGFLFFATVMAALAAGVLLFPRSLVEELRSLNEPAFVEFEKWGKWPAVLLLALGVGTAAAGRAMLKRKRWGWWFAVALFAANGCGDVAGFVITRDFLRSGSGVLIAGALLACLFRAEVRGYFRPASPS
jgi:hypothetical protein